MKILANVGNWVSQSKRRLYLLFLPLMIVPIALFAYSASRVLKAQTERQAAAESAQIAHLSAGLVSEHFRQGTILLESIAMRPTLVQAWRHGDKELITWNLRSAKSLRADFSFVSLYDLTGTMRAIYPANAALVGRNFAYRDWYKGLAEQWRPYVSEVYKTDVPPYQMVVAIAVPVLDEQGHPIAILMGTDSLDTLDKHLAETRLQGGWNIRLVDKNGYVAAQHGGDSEMRSADKGAFDFFTRPAQDPNPAQVSNRDIASRFATYQAAAEPGWGIVVEQSDGALQRGIGAVEKRLWLLGAVFLVLGLVVSTFMGTLYSRLESGNRFVKMSIDMFCTIGADGFFKSLNPSWQKVLGFTPSELMAKPRLHFIHPDDRALTTAETDRLERGEVIQAFENRYLCKDGSYKWLLWNAVSGPEQGVIYAVARDITGRKQAEAKVRESEERYRRLFELNPQPTWIYDRNTLRFLAVNKAAIDNYGYSYEEFLSMTIADIRPSEDVSALMTSVSKLHDNEKSHGVWRHRRKDGNILFVEITSYSFDFAGYSADFVIAVDVTEQLRAEKERQQFTERLGAANQELEIRNREVERATKLKSKFLASMSHELRTPLNAIVGFSELLADGGPGDLNPKQKRFVNHIKQGSVHLLQLINDILDLSKIEAGQLELHCEDFLIADALPEVLSTIRPLAMAKNIEVKQKLETDKSVYADRVRFKQVLYNLLSNAVKFTPRDGHITIRCYSDGPAVTLSVTDTGIGIRREDQELVFEEFRQVEGEAGTVQEGTGLGLAITRRLVEQQGGKIWLESEPGKGSCFAFTLPHGAATADVAATIPPLAIPVAAIESARKPLVLIVDDEAAARELMASYLETEYRIAFANSGAETIRKARELLPDVITLDVLMPGGTGFETLVALHAVPETAQIPVIIVSIVDQQRVGFALGATDYLIKPIHKPALLEAIRKHVAVKTDDDAAILLVDDDPKNLELVTETLRSAGYETQSVRSGARALEVLQSKLVGAVVLDLLMPGMDGFQVIRHVRQDPALRNLPILVMTGKSLTREEIELLNQDTQGFFQKAGAWPQQLSAEVGRVLQRQSAAKAAGQS